MSALTQKANQDSLIQKVDDYIAAQAKLDLLRFITCGSVDDGKSTLIGRMLYEAQMIFEDQVTSLRSDSKRMCTQGGEIDFALLVDGLAAERERLTVIDDQHGAPTGADLIADVTAHAIRATLMQPALGGLYHLVASGQTTWHGYASHVIAQARLTQPGLALKVGEIAAVPTSAFPTPAQRPLNSRLATHKLQEAFGLVLPPWQQGVNRMLAEVL